MATQPFVWGSGGRRLTPEQIAQQRAIAQQQMQTGMDYSPIGHWSQGLSRVAQGLLGGLEMRELAEQEAQNAEENRRIAAALLRGGNEVSFATPPVAIEESAELVEPETGSPIASLLVEQDVAEVSPEAGGAPKGQALMPQQGVNPAIIEALTSPSTDPMTRQIALQMWQQQNATKEPLDIINAGDGALYDPNTGQWITAPRYGEQDLPSSVREYEYARSQGYPGSYQQFQTDLKRAGAITVDARQMGTIPPGYRANYDAQGRVVSLEPIPGSPAATELQQASTSREAKEEQAQTWNRIVNQEIGRALEIIDNSGLPTTGAIGNLLSGVGGTGARDLRGLLDTIRANAGFDRLQQMRDASPTGGALGAVSERELAFLQSTIGNLEQSQSTEQLKFNLRRLQRIYENMLNGRRAYDGLLQNQRGQTARRIEDMTDDELRALING